MKLNCVIETFVIQMSDRNNGNFFPTNVAKTSASVIYSSMKTSR